MTKEIPLSVSSTNRQENWVALVDDGDYAELVQYSWSYHDGYAERRVQQNGVIQVIFMHQILCPCLPGYEPHHIDDNRLNNQRSNLEAVTRSRHLLLSKKRRDNISGFRGVSWNGQRSKWQARVTVYGTCYHLGFFDTPEEANEVLVEFRAYALTKVQ